MKNLSMDFTIPIVSFLLLLLNPHRVVSHLDRISPVDDISDPSTLKTYIVQVRPPPETTNRDGGDHDVLHRWYQSFLPTTAASSTTQRIVHQYHDVITGFAARLTEQELKEMEAKDGFLKAHPDRTLKLHTTHTPSFLGLDKGSSGLWSTSGFGKGVIIGVIDTGIHPGHPSFSDKGISPPPEKWRGVCAFKGIGCNNKIIGARSFQRSKGPVVLNDTDGHGTHTASTAAGNFFKNADVLGNGKGTAVGMAPHAHLAIYKACDVTGCNSADVMAGMDAAIADGVDVMSLSFGGAAGPFYDETIAIGAFSAVEKGILVSCSAGNDGPEPSTVTNGAPWILTVGATTMDRNIRATVKLGDGREFNGESAFQPADFSPTMLSLVHPAPELGPANCLRKFANLSGKVVICGRADNVNLVTMGNTVRKADAVAMIIVNQELDAYTTVADSHHLPASHVGYADGFKITSYANSSNNATASIIYKGTITRTSPAPVVACFSSRGPSEITPGILKPDVIGPGVNIIAGWPFPVGPPTAMISHSEAATFNIISGTSMSAPHLSGIAALVKGEHPDWSPAAIKSAIITTADILGNDGKPIKDEQLKPASFFTMGAGHVNPSKAADPGLVYDINGGDVYVSYLCGLRYTDRQVEIVTRRNVSCSAIKSVAESELNYPSITVHLVQDTVTVNRTVTNVGEAGSTYSANVKVLEEGVAVTVSPQWLNFSAVNEKKSFTVSVTRSEKERKLIEGILEWISDKHVVRSPIVIY